MKRSTITSPLTDRLVALGDVLRLRICQLLEKEELTVGELGRVLQVPQSTTSRHLRVLNQAGLLAKRADGTASYYRINGNLENGLANLWQAIRDAANESESLAAAIQGDDQRLQAILAERRTDSLAFFGRVAGEWDKVRADLFGQHFAMGALPALFPPQWTVADIGCGTGANAALIAPFVREVVCVDQSTPMLDAARQRLADFDHINFVRAAIEDLPLEDDSVDAVLCLLVLHHVTDPLQGLCEVRRVLRPGGRLLVVDMQQHDREAYRHTMGHVHLGFALEQIAAWCDELEMQARRLTPLPTDTEARGPGLFAAMIEKPK